MKKLFEIKSRFTGDTLFKTECESMKVCVETAVKNSTNLSRADLSGANLSGANLPGADLSRANLSEADLSGADGKRTTIEKHPLQIYGLRWPIIIFDKDMKIGCEYHPITDWFGFDDARIKEMDKNALDFWQKNKIAIKAICDANGRQIEREEVIK